MAGSVFRHRAFSGWATDFSSVPLPESWPSVRLDDRLQRDLEHAFGRAREAGYNEVILWGLACGRAWEPNLPDTVAPERAERIRRVMAAARGMSLSVLWGVGIYSWGYDRIISQHPEVDGGSDVAMCLSRPSSARWVERVLAYIADTFNPDGYSMQSADLGRCPCDECAALSPLEYHRKAIGHAAGFIKSRWPSRIVQVSTWGLELGGAGSREAVLALCRDVDVLNDQSGSAGQPGSEARRALIQALASAGCSYGTENGWYVDPPPSWRRDRWFLPIAGCNVPYFRALAGDGGSAVERYILPLANPAAEVGFLFDGFMLSAPEGDERSALERSLDLVFRPTPSGRETLLGIWRDVETAYTDGTTAGRAVRSIAMSSEHYTGPESADRRRFRPQYLIRLPTGRLEHYRAALERARARLDAARSEMGDQERAAALDRCIGASLSDALRVLAWRGA